MIQYAIVTIVIAIAIAYAIRMLIRTIKVSRNACGRCPGCAIKLFFAIVYKKFGQTNISYYFCTRIKALH